MPAGIFEEIVRLRERGERCALATIIEARGSIPSYETAKMLVREDGSIEGTIGGGCVEADVWAAAKEVMATGKPRRMSFTLNQDAAYDNGLICGGQLDVLIELVLPTPQALIFGAGHISKSLSKAAVLAGFDVTVIDDRDSFANRDRFPEPVSVIAAEYEPLFSSLRVSSHTFIVIVTRGHRDDMRVLRWAVTTEAAYIGMIGSRRKALSIAKELEAEGIGRERFARVSSPMGLAIGAVTPEEIAIAVVAEMIAVRRGAQAALENASLTVLGRQRRPVMA